MDAVFFFVILAGTLKMAFGELPLKQAAPI